MGGDSMSSNSFIKGRMKAMKTALKVVGMVIIFLLTMVAVDQAFALLRAKSDVAVVGGVGILLGVLFFYAWALPSVYKWVRNMLKACHYPSYCLWQWAYSHSWDVHE